MSHIASGGSQMPSFSPVFSKLSLRGMPPDPTSIASPLTFGLLALKLHWQILADIGRYFQNLSANWQTFFFLACRGRMSGFAATVIPWDIVLCNVVKYKWNTDSCDSYLHVIMTKANSTSLMSLWANIRFFPEPTGEFYGWLLATLVLNTTLKIFGFSAAASTYSSVWQLSMKTEF